MASEIRFNFEQYDGQLAKSCMERLRKAAGIIQLDAILKCKVGSVTRKPGRTHFVRDHKLVESTDPPFWMEREIGALRRTIRVTEKTGESGLVGRDVRVIAGNRKTWYALQVEYGRGGWKGGAHPFLRPAMRGRKAEIQRVIEGG